MVYKYITRHKHIDVKVESTLGLLTTDYEMTMWTPHSLFHHIFLLLLTTNDCYVAYVWTNQSKQEAVSRKV